MFYLRWLALIIWCKGCFGIVLREREQMGYLPKVAI